MTQEQIQSPMIDKVRKLLALSKSANAYEAAAAAAKANQYIAQYRLNEADLLEKHAGQMDSTGEEIFDDPNPIYETARTIEWKYDLLKLLAMHYGCAVWNDAAKNASKGGRSISRYRLAGRYNDVQFTRNMFCWIVATMQGHAELEVKGQGPIAFNSYCKGAIDGIEKLLKETREEQKQKALQAGQSKALARIDNRVESAKQFLAQRYGYIEAKPKFNQDAYDRGYAAGSNMGKQLSASTD